MAKIGSYTTQNMGSNYVFMSWSHISKTDCCCIYRHLIWRLYPWLIYGLGSDLVTDKTSDPTISRLWEAQTQGSWTYEDLYSSYKCYRQISQSILTARLGVKMIESWWYLTGASAALLPRRLSKFRTIRSVESYTPWIGQFARYSGKILWQLSA